MGARVKNDGSVYRTNVKRDRYLPYNIFLKKADLQRFYSGRPSEAISLFDYTHAVLDQDAGCTCTTAFDEFEAQDLFIPESIFVNSTTTDTATREGFNDAIDLVKVIATVKRSDLACDDAFTFGRGFYSPKVLEQLYIPKMVTVKDSKNSRDTFGAFNTTLTERANNAVNLRTHIIELATVMGICV